MRVTVTGKAAHSGANFENGISAIEELAHKIAAWHALTDVPRGITVNVGLVRGGQTVNTVAPSAEADIDLRFLSRADRDLTMRGFDRSWTRPTPRHGREAGSLRRIPAAERDARQRAALPALCRLRRGARAEYSFGVHRRLRRFRICRKCRCADPVRDRADRRESAYARRISGARLDGAARAGAGTRDSAVAGRLSRRVWPWPRLYEAGLWGRAHAFAKRCRLSD